MPSANEAAVIIIDSDTDGEEGGTLDNAGKGVAQVPSASRREPAQPQATRSPYGPNWGTNLIAQDSSPASSAAVRASSSATPSGSVNVRKRKHVGVSGQVNRPLRQVPKTPVGKAVTRGASSGKMPLTETPLTTMSSRLRSGKSSKEAKGLADGKEKPTEKGGNGYSQGSPESKASSVSEGIKPRRWAPTTPAKKTPTRRASTAKASIRKSAARPGPGGSSKDTKAPANTGVGTLGNGVKQEASVKTPEPELYYGPFYIGPDSPEPPDTRIPVSYRAGSDISDGLSD